jgi:Arc/MetJ family transcription regulator
MAQWYGMKKTLHIDEALLREARAASGARTDTEAVKLGLEALVRQAAYDRLRALRGTEPKAAAVRRRKEEAATKHPAA